MYAKRKQGSEQTYVVDINVKKQSQVNQTALTILRSFFPYFEMLVNLIVEHDFLWNYNYIKDNNVIHHTQRNSLQKRHTQLKLIIKGFYFTDTLCICIKNKSTYPRLTRFSQKKNQSDSYLNCFRKILELVITGKGGRQGT